MNRISGALLSMIAAGALGVSSSVLADNPLGVYIGAGAGVSNIGNNNYPYNYGYNGNFGNNLVWKVMAGIRPISIVGAELEYIDFGSNNGHDGYYGNYYFYGPNSHPKATVAYGVGYLPLPFLDVYGKLGVARLQTDITSFSFPPGYQNCSTCAPIPNRIDQSDNKFAYGVGVQTHFQDFAFRAEYEGINSQYGNPAAFTVGFTWTF
jgi:outer membrane protein with beta-barrel domain